MMFFIGRWWWVVFGVEKIEDAINRWAVWVSTSHVRKGGGKGNACMAFHMQSFDTASELTSGNPSYKMEAGITAIVAGCPDRD